MPDVDADVVVLAFKVLDDGAIVLENNGGPIIIGATEYAHGSTPLMQLPMASFMNPNGLMQDGVHAVVETYGTASIAAGETCWDDDRIIITSGTTSYDVECGATFTTPNGRVAFVVSESVPNLTIRYNDVRIAIDPINCFDSNGEIISRPVRVIGDGAMTPEYCSDKEDI